MMMCLLRFEGGELPHNALHFYFFFPYFIWKLGRVPSRCSAR